MLYFLFYPLLEIGLNSIIQYKYHPGSPWLFPFYPFNKYKLIHRIYYMINFLFLTFIIGYILKSPLPDLHIIRDCKSLLGLLLLESGIVYYGHRYIHYNKFLFNHVHKVHHEYIEVRPFEGSCASPVDILFFTGLILFLPFYIFQLSRPFYYLYILIIIGTGILDHSGTTFKFLCYNSDYHKTHHTDMRKNYGFPLTIYDILHGTHEE